MATVECLCPPKATGEPRHPDGDTVTLRERLDFRAALTARNTIVLTQQEGGGTAEILAALTECYLILGIASWTVLDAKGKAVEPNRQTITDILLSRPDEAMTVGDEADALYSASVIDPLVARASNSSQPSPTPVSTSPTNGSGQRHPKPSKRSSTTTTPTAAIAATT